MRGVVRIEFKLGLLSTTIFEALGDMDCKDNAAYMHKCMHQFIHCHAGYMRKCIHQFFHCQDRKSVV